MVVGKAGFRHAVEHCAELPPVAGNAAPSPFLFDKRFRSFAINHVVHALLKVVERLIVIDFGKMIAEGDPATVMESREVKEIYLGIEADA
ncbi:hypothetical protein K1W69_20565 [Hoeflea sp. WL0058]|uniref:Branched-chain amino acid ATP-binding cassette transporter C-terminal domain-containing protein n=1 Tax=Flavimaribacter sediminis TaxID=2865987 RepID=A0AAE2ZS96_9HYPH|nr:hypothetical protein [Flavimaribacter sediminis]